MSKQDPFFELLLPRRSSATHPPEFATRLPRFMGATEDAGQRFASMRVLVVGGGSIGLEIAQQIARWQALEIAIVDPKVFKSESPLTHPIPLTAVGKSKALYAAGICKCSSPRTRVFWFKGVFASVPLSRLVEFDVVFLATDNLLVELQVTQVCLALRIPVVQGSVHGASLCGHVRFFGHGAAEEPCAACGFTREEWAHLNRSTTFSCDGSGSRDAGAFVEGQPTNSLNALCSLIAQLVLLQFAKDLLALGAPVRNTILEYCAYTHRTVLTQLIRNPNCPCEHVVLRRAVPPRPLSECTFCDLSAVAEAPGKETSFEIDSSLWVEQARCQCGAWRSVRKFVAFAAKSIGRCGKCRQLLTGHPFHSHRRVPVSAIETLRKKRLRDLGERVPCAGSLSVMLTPPSSFSIPVNPVRSHECSRAAATAGRLRPRPNGKGTAGRSPSRDSSARSSEVRRFAGVANSEVVRGVQLLALSQISNRLVILFLDLREDIRVHLMMRAPVPCLPDPTGPLRIEPAAELALVYRQAGVIEPQPGYSVVCLLNPLHAWHPNIGPSESGQRICLGPTLFAGIRLREILFLVYRALTLQTVQFDAFDSAGVMNSAAADWWQRNTDRIPLTTESFLRFGEAKPSPAKGIE